MGRPTGATREGECVLHGAPWPVEVRWEKERRRREKNHHYEGNAVMIKAKTAARNPESLRLKGEGHPAHTYNAKHVLRGATIT